MFCILVIHDEFLALGFEKLKGFGQNALFFGEIYVWGLFKTYTPLFHAGRFQKP